ncbi:MAG: hypothetical protein RSE41_06820 [Clostridia bacterium]
MAFTPPTSYYIALSKTDPQSNNTGVTEPTGGNYARIRVDKNTTNFLASSNGVVKNKVSLLSNETTAAWGNLPYYAIYDAATGGNLLWGGTLVNPRNMDIEMQLIIDPNGLTFTLGD